MITANIILGIALIIVAGVSAMAIGILGYQIKIMDEKNDQDWKDLVSVEVHLDKAGEEFGRLFYEEYMPASEQYRELPYKYREIVVNAVALERAKQKSKVQK